MNPSMTGTKCTCSFFFQGDIIRTKSLQSQGHKLWLTLPEHLKPDWISYDARIWLYLVIDNTSVQLLGDVGYFGQEKCFSLQDNHGIQQAIADFSELTIDIRCKKPRKEAREPQLWYWHNGQRTTLPSHANPRCLFKVELLKNGQREGSYCFTDPFNTVCKSSNVNIDGGFSQITVVTLKDSQLSSSNNTNSSNLGTPGHDTIDLSDLSVIDSQWHSHSPLPSDNNNTEKLDPNPFNTDDKLKDNLSPSFTRHMPLTNYIANHSDPGIYDDAIDLYSPLNQTDSSEILVEEEELNGSILYLSSDEIDQLLDQSPQKRQKH